MKITICLTRVVNGGHLVEPLDWLAESCIASESVSFANDPLGCSLHHVSQNTYYITWGKDIW